MAVKTIWQARDESDKAIIKQALIETRGNISKASRMLELSREHMYVLMGKHGLKSKRLIR